MLVVGQVRSRLGLAWLGLWETIERTLRTEEVVDIWEYACLGSSGDVRIFNPRCSAEITGVYFAFSYAEAPTCVGSFRFCRFFRLRDVS